MQKKSIVKTVVSSDTLKMDLLPNILLPIMVHGDTSEVEKETNYLGVFFFHVSSLFVNQRHLCTQAQKAMNGKIRKKIKINIQRFKC